MYKPENTKYNITCLILGTTLLFTPPTYITEDAITCDFSIEESELAFPGMPCAFRQDEQDDELDWSHREGATPSPGTGPQAGHTDGSSGDHYVYLESSYGEEYNSAV